ncbi:MAG TPA: carbamoyltransferase C-terminal domain-containing protein [Thermoanaerobaculia bacterium]|nr:carbamoyltransferase C-terminal domain-containing protein [Thermoanaerobaculia bacterium]
MSVILGINAFHASASAAIIVDGVPVAAIAEERLNRIKYYAGFPKLAVLACMKEAGVGFKDIDAVAIGRDPSANRAKKMEYTLLHPTKIVNLMKTRSSRSQLDDLRTLFVKHCGANADDLRFEEYQVEHHLAHIASAFFISPWDSAAGFSVDGSGDFVTVMMAECKGSEINVKKRIYVPHSLGNVYLMICEFIGYGRYGDEGKVMGLAPLGENTYKEQFDDMIQLTDDGFKVNPKYFMPFGSNPGMTISDDGEMVIHRHYSEFMMETFGPPRRKEDELTKRDLDLAFGVQYLFEKTYMHLLNILHKLVPIERVAMAGGCALNSVANGKMFHETPFKETVIQPAAGDDGLSIGAALYVSNSILEEGRRSITNNAYLGESYSDEQIEDALQKAGISYERLDRDELIERTAAEIVKGNVIGWYQGRMEWGPRALGNRSIITHPGFPGMKDILNARIKRREWFRPFAPAVLIEQQADIFDYDHPSPYMLHVYKIRPEWRERISAVNHEDNTGRLQSVARDENPMYYDLIKAFERRTGIPVVLNTSFNENEPIVNTPAEAIDCFARTKMDVLSIGSFFCKKAE